jgi:hypothetical protein
MKKLIFSCLLFAGFAAGAQDADEIKPAAKGVVYGNKTATEQTAISVDELQAKMANGAFQGLVTGKVVEVCQTMGCWMKIQKSDGSTLMVKTKAHAFFMPKDIVGKTVAIEGTASIKEETEAKRKHYAEDAGKSKKEIAKIKGSSTEVQFNASSVEVLD